MAQFIQRRSGSGVTDAPCSPFLSSNQILGSLLTGHVTWDGKGLFASVCRSVTLHFFSVTRLRSHLSTNLNKKLHPHVR